MTDHDPDPTRVEQAVDPTSVFAPEGAGGPPTGVLPPVGRGPAGPPPPDRRPWVIAGLVVLILAMLVLLVLTRDDGDEGTATSSTTTSEPSTTTSTSTSSTTSTTVATTTTQAPVVTVPPAECKAAGAGPAKPGTAAQAVYDAWTRGDQACAAELMTAPALAKLFARDGTGAQDAFQGCSEVLLPDPHVDCGFTYEGGATHYLLRYGATSGWQVYDVTQVAD